MPTCIALSGVALRRLSSSGLYRMEFYVEPCEHFPGLYCVFVSIWQVGSMEVMTFSFVEGSDTTKGDSWVRAPLAVGAIMRVFADGPDWAQYQIHVKPIHSAPPAGYGYPGGVSWFED